MSWTDYSSAPTPGTRICDAAEITTILALTVTTAKGDFPLLILRTGQGLRAYVNACPHQYLPLDYRGTQLMSADGTRLMCTAHGAQFDIESGAVIRGADCGLDMVPIDIVNGEICIGSAFPDKTD